MQQQASVTTKTIGVKATFVPTNEHRFVALPAPPSFAVLVDKLAGLFGIESDLRVHYVDDESDRVAMSSSDELTCALSLVPAGRQLRLFVSTAPSPLHHQQDVVLVKNEPTKEEQDCALPTVISTVVNAGPTSVASSVTALESTGLETAAIDVLKIQLQAAGVEINEKQCQRVLARFEGDVAKAAQAIERMHERKQLRQQKQINRLPEEGKVEASQGQREARKSERLAARLARQEQRKQKQLNKQLGVIDDNDVNGNTEPRQRKTKPEDSAAIESLMTFIAGREGAPIAPIGRGKCVAAWRKAGGDVEGAKAALLAWSDKSHQRQHKCKGADLDIAKLLEQLEGLGFGAPAIPTNNDDGDDVCKAKKESERIQRRNERLIKRFGGELSLVVEFLEASQAKVGARKTTVRKAREPRCGRRNHDLTKKMRRPNEQVATAL